MMMLWLYERSVLTTVHPTNSEIRDYFNRLAEILESCVARARFYQTPLRYDQLENHIVSNVEMIIRYIRDTETQ